MFKKKLGINNLKIKNSSLNLKKNFSDSILKSEITSSNPSMINIKNNEIRKSSVASCENKKIDKSKLYI